MNRSRMLVALCSLLAVTWFLPMTASGSVGKIYVAEDFDATW